MALTSRELWACAYQILEQYGDGAKGFVAERIEALALQDSLEGTQAWKAIASRIGQLRSSTRDRAHC
jgi:hypothetical protein